MFVALFLALMPIGFATCPLGYYQGQSECMTCPPHCIQCTSSLQCDVCSAQPVIEVSDVSLISTQAATFSQAQTGSTSSTQGGSMSESQEGIDGESSLGLCKNCWYPCQQCNGQTMQCIRCNEGYLLNEWQQYREYNKNYSRCIEDNNYINMNIRLQGRRLRLDLQRQQFINEVAANINVNRNQVRIIEILGIINVQLNISIYCSNCQQLYNRINYDNLKQNNIIPIDSVGNVTLVAQNTSNNSTISNTNHSNTTDSTTNDSNTNDSNTTDSTIDLSNQTKDKIFSNTSNENSTPINQSDIDTSSTGESSQAPDLIPKGLNSSNSTAQTVEQQQQQFRYVYLIAAILTALVILILACICYYAKKYQKKLEQEYNPQNVTMPNRSDNRLRESRQILNQGFGQITLNQADITLSNGYNEEQLTAIQNKNTFNNILTPNFRSLNTSNIEQMLDTNGVPKQLNQDKIDTYEQDY